MKGVPHPSWCSKGANPGTALVTARHRELTTKRRGELAELAFTLKAARLGLGVSKPFGDSERYDVIVDARELVPRRDCKPVSDPGCPILRAAQISGTPKSGCSFYRRLRTSAAPSAPIPCSPPLWRVQIKGSSQIENGLYHLNAHRRTGRRAVPYRPGEIDFLAAYIIPEDMWYIIPLHAFLGSTSLLFRRPDDLRPGLYDAYREAWHLLCPK